MVTVRILGPLDLLVNDRRVALGERPAMVLALLAAQIGRVVTRDQLIDAVWETDPPATARAQITIHVSALRKACGDPTVIETVRSGYRLDPDTVRTDLETAEELVTRARKTADPDLFREAARHWRGPVLADLPGAAVGGLARRLEGLRLTVLEEWAALACGGPGELVDRLTQAVADHPLRETLRARLMEQYWYSGDFAEALAVYRDCQRLLDVELGVQPSPELRDLHERILRGEAPPTVLDGVPPRRQIPYPVPSQLPPSISAFTGRVAETATLHRFLDADGGHLRIAVISGTAGVGKTTLAVHWAHQVVDLFPDGQLFADLRGYDELAEPATAGEVLERFLPALGVPADQIPSDHEQRAALFRSTLRERKLLILLDNAASTAQLRPLLPGTSGCVVVVTARRRLEDLVARHGAIAVPVDIFDAEESAELLTRVVGPDRADLEAEATRQLSDLCGGLPLALRIAAARVVARPTWTLSRLAARMTSERDRLDLLSGEDLQVRGTFALSYRHLPERAAATFRRLALVDAPAGISGWLVAALVGEPDLEVAERLLEDLVDAHLLQPLAVDPLGRSRYRFHDLVRLFARERAEVDDSEHDRNAALERAYGALLGLAEQAGRGFRGKGGLEEVHGNYPRWLPRNFEALLTEPLEWLDAERLNLTAAVRQAARSECSELCWDLTVTSSILHRRRGYLDDQRAKYDVALDLCRRVGDLKGEAALLLMHNDFHVRRGEIDQAADATSRAARLFGWIGDRRAQALAMTEFAIVKRILGEWSPALSACADAAAYFGAAGDAASRAYVEYILGTVHLGRERPMDAERAAERGLAAAPPTAQEVKLHLRLLHAESILRQGRSREAIDILDSLLPATRKRGDLRMEVQALLLLGEARLATGDRHRGMSILTEALHRARRLGDRLLEGRSMLTIGRSDPSRRVDFLDTAARIFAHQGHKVWHAEALAARV